MVYFVYSVYSVFAVFSVCSVFLVFFLCERQQRNGESVPSSHLLKFSFDGIDRID